MQKSKHLSDELKRKRPPPDWGNLSNEPRNENIARVRGPTSFEKDENDRNKERGPRLLSRFNKNKDRDPQS